MSTQPQRFVIRHLSGSKANQVEEFPFAAFEALTIGRGGATDIVYDPDQDELVSREHVKITKDGDDTYSITDLGSRNGTFVNKVQVAGTASIRPGDTVQLGNDGPEFVFDAEPRPARETVIASPRASKATTLSPSLASAADRAPAKAGVGRETVERIVTDSRQQSQKKNTGALLGVSAGILAVVAALFFFIRKDTGDAQQRTQQQTQAALDSVNAAREAELAANPTDISPADITREHGEGVVFIENSWRLINADTDKPMLHQYEQVPMGGATQTMAVYLQLPDGRIEPWITYADPNGLNKPIRGAGTGSGFVISQDGFIMTNKHVVATWDYPYSFPEDAFPGVMYSLDQTGNFVAQRDQAGNVVTDRAGNPVPQTQILQRGQMPQWIPTETQWVEQRPVENIRALKGVPSIQVTFENSSIPFEAELERMSPRADAATIKIDAQEPLHAVTLYDSYDSTEIGDAVVIMGYPGISGTDVVTGNNREVIGQQARARIVPRLTSTPANVSSIARSRRTDDPDERVVSVGFQDAYQLSTSATGSGNSGGPVFDGQGRVIGLFTYGVNNPGDAAVTYAIPIKYGMELTRASEGL